MSGITETMFTALTTVQSDATTMIGTVLPFALAIAGAVLVIRLGWRAFKSFTGRG